MRIYTTLPEAIRETERDLFEMGIDVHVQTMQDKFVKDDPQYITKEIRGYGFKVVDRPWTCEEERKSVEYLFKEPEAGRILDYISEEYFDRTAPKPSNPGNSFQSREKLWDEFLHDGLFAYTYSERMNPQLEVILQELKDRPDTRQAIINIHSNIKPSNHLAKPIAFLGVTHLVESSADLENMGGHARIPCSMYYQTMVREEKVDLIYTMRSCDFLNHFVVDVLLAMRLQLWFASQLGRQVGTFTYFTGSLHAYKKDMTGRGIF